VADVFQQTDEPAAGSVPSENRPGIFTAKLPGRYALMFFPLRLCAFALKLVQIPQDSNWVPLVFANSRHSR
jgi:hypothetical protein